MVRTIIAAGTTLLMEAADVELFDPETGAYADLTAPDTINFVVKNAVTGATVSTIAGNQQGSTNTYNAQYTFSATGTFTWQASITEGSVTLVTRAYLVKVE